MPIKYRVLLALTVKVALAFYLVCVAGVASAEALLHRSQQDVMTFLQDYHPSVATQNHEISFADLLAQLATKRAILVGETHDRYDHHLNQLAILQGMYKENPNLAVGVEWFQLPFQGVLDAYLAGRINETMMLKESEYYSRWRYDYRMIRPIIEFAHTHRLPIIALNVPLEITQKVALSGLAGLSASERAMLPSPISPPDQGYLMRLRTMFDSNDRIKFENFAIMQRIWDATMAANVAKFLRYNPRSTMLVFTGSGHIAGHSGLTKDLATYLTGEQIVTVLTSHPRDVQFREADYFVLSKTQYYLPRTGKLGVWLEPSERGVLVGNITEQSVAGKAGIQTKDRLVKINDAPIDELADVLIELGHYGVGESVELTIERRKGQTKAIPTLLKFKIVLQ